MATTFDCCAAALCAVLLCLGGKYVKTYVLGKLVSSRSHQSGIQSLAETGRHSPRPWIGSETLTAIVIPQIIPVFALGLVASVIKYESKSLLENRSFPPTRRATGRRRLCRYK